MPCSMKLQNTLLHRHTRIIRVCYVIKSLLIELRTLSVCRLPEAHAVLFNLLNLHWDGYVYPKGPRDPNQLWVLLFYESTSNNERRYELSLIHI